MKNYLVNFGSYANSAWPNLAAPNYKTAFDSNNRGSRENNNNQT
jgi:hypothetical protein